MINQSEINIALAAADQPIMVESAGQLHQAIKTWLGCEVIGIDTEFVRERTWRADLGLVQLSDGERVWLVDPLKTGPLHPLAALLEDKNIVKILHAPSEDLDVLLYTILLSIRVRPAQTGASGHYVQPSYITRRWMSSCCP